MKPPIICILFLLWAQSATLAAQSTDDFFDSSNLHEIRLEINPRDWNKLQENFADNTYYPANFLWRGEVAYSVGIRSRGLGSRSAIKPGLRVDFDRYEKDQKFLGLKSIVLDNGTQDNSQLRERVAMALFQRMGIAAPRETHARLFLNNEYFGVYAIVESIDKDFLERNFSEKDGHLYEYNWVEPYYFEFRGEDPSIYSPVLFDPKTHEKDPDPKPLVDMIRAVNEAPDEEFASTVAQYLDLNLLARYLAVENYLAEVDGFLGYAGMNNFYLYRFTGQSRFQFIPWDKDVAFAGADHPVLYNVDQNVLGRRLLAVPEFRATYFATLKEAASIAGGAGGWLEQEIDRVYGQIRGAIFDDMNKQCPSQGDAPSCPNEVVEGEVQFLKDWATVRHDFVIGELQAIESLGENR